MKPVMGRRSASFGWIALGAIPALLLIATAVPNLWTALQRSRQKRTMTDIRSIATALEALATQAGPNAIGPAPACWTHCSFASLTPVPLDALERMLTPKYMTNMPRLDGWGNELEVRFSAHSYAIRARGSDDRFDTDTYRLNDLATTFADDLVFGDGNWIQYPEGL